MFKNRTHLRKNTFGSRFTNPIPAAQHWHFSLANFRAYQNFVQRVVDASQADGDCRRASEVKPTASRQNKAMQSVAPISPNGKSYPRWHRCGRKHQKTDIWLIRTIPCLTLDMESDRAGFWRRMSLKMKGYTYGGYKLRTIRVVLGQIIVNCKTQKVYLCIPDGA